MSDVAMVDMGPFMRRHDRRSRRFFVAMTTISLLTSAAIFTHGVLGRGSPQDIAGSLWTPILICPLLIIVFWHLHVRAARKRLTRPDGSLPTNPDDARNAARIANVGAALLAGFGVVLIVVQVATALAVFGALPGLHGTSLGRALTVGMGALMAYWGNAFPRMPTARAPDKKPATQSRFNRIYGWVVVILGLLMVIVGLLSPDPSVGVGIISLSTVLFAAIWIISYRRAMKGVWKVWRWW